MSHLLKMFINKHRLKYMIYQLLNGGLKMRKTSLLLFILLSLFLFASCVEENQEKMDIKLLYSSSYENFNDFDEPILLILNYDDYVLSGYALSLEEAFFDDYILYTYAFYHNVLGTNIFLYKQYEMTEANILNIFYEMDESVIVSEAFGMYAMIFQIEKQLYQNAESIHVLQFNDYS